MVLELLTQIDAALTDLQGKKDTLLKESAASETVRTDANAAYAAAVHAAEATRTAAIAGADQKLATATKAHADAVAKAEALKHQLDDQFAGLSRSDGRVRVS